MASLRFLLRQRGYLALSVATLVLAVGANLVVFTIVNALWLRPRPVTDPDRVVMVMGDASSAGSTENFWFAEHGLQQEVRDLPVFSLVAGQVMISGFNAALTPRVSLDAVGHPVEALAVTSEYFRVLGLAVQGRDFSPADDRDGAAPVVIISERLWRSAFAGRPDVLGRLLPASPFPVQVIGVAPKGFSGARLGEQADMWVPRSLVPRVSSLASASSLAADDLGGMLAIARLQPWVSVAEAQRAVAAHQSADLRAMTRLIVVPLSAVFGAPDHRTLLINEGPVLKVIAATSLAVLAGGCATLMALVLVHYERRRTEFAIRLAIGASRARLFGRLSEELVWVVAVGFAGAVMIASWSIRALPSLSLPGGVDLARLDLRVDWTVAAAGLCASAATIIVAASVPLIRFTRGNLASSLVSSATTASPSSLSLRKVMLAVHVAATVVALVAASLFVRTVSYGFGGGAGFDIDHTLFVSVDVGTPFDGTVAARARTANGNAPTTYAEWRALNTRISADLTQRRRARADDVLTALHELPGVDVIALGAPPLGADQAASIAEPKSVEFDGHQRRLPVGTLAGDPNYLQALGVRLIAGRPLTDADAQDLQTPVPALISASLANALWPGVSPIGRLARIGRDYTVVGVVADFAFGSMRFDPPATIVTAIGRRSRVFNTVSVVLGARDPGSLAESVRRAVENAVPGAPRIMTTSGQDLIAVDLGRERLGAWFFSGFGLVAVALGIGGVFGLIAYLAESRRREFGIRIALGATSGTLLRIAITAGMIPAVVGAAAGLLGAAWLAGAAKSFLIGVTPFDFTSFVGVPMLTLLVAAAAGLAAAWRLRRLSAMEALRTD